MSFRLSYKARIANIFSMPRSNCLVFSLEIKFVKTVKSSILFLNFLKSEKVTEGLLIDLLYNYSGDLRHVEFYFNKKFIKRVTP